MECEPHRTEQCPACKPAMAARWTLGDFRRATAGLPDDTPLAASVALPDDPEFADTQVITSGGFGTVNWGDGYGDEQSPVFELNCHYPERDLLVKPDRPPRKGQR